MGKNNYVVAIDLGFNKVVAALGTLAADGSTVAKEIVTKPLEGGFVRGEITNIDSVSTALNSAIEELEQRAGIKIDDAVVGVSGQQIVFATNSGFVYVGSDGEIHQEDEQKLCENMNNVQAPSGKVILSRLPLFYKIDAREIKGSPVGGFGRHLEATYGYIMADKAILERLDKTFDRVGIKGRTYLPAASASAIAASFEEEREMGVAVVDIGGNTTDVGVYFDKKLRYACSIPLGSDNINSDILTTAMPKYAIEKLKTKYGYATASIVPFEILNSLIRIPGRSAHEKKREISYRDLTAIIECRLIEIINFVNEELKESGYHNRIETIVLTGGGAQLKGIDELFKERTGIATRVGGAAALGEGSAEEAAAPANTTVVGLLTLGLAQAGVTATVDEEPKEEKNNNGTPGGGKKEDKKRFGLLGIIKGGLKKLGDSIVGQDFIDDEEM
ncbi:MAG: cell division protein FtsA [Tidjanibacter sp.]|nr:cell division protein FtsA [Tidjanibacter sp.]